MLALTHAHTPTGYVCSVSPVCTNMRWGGSPAFTVSRHFCLFL